VRLCCWPPALHPLQDVILWREDGSPQDPKSPDWKSGANIMRGIHISALKRGESEEQTSRICVQLLGLRPARLCRSSRMQYLQMAIDKNGRVRDPAPTRHIAFTSAGQKFPGIAFSLDVKESHCPETQRF